jgi:hypothetical protein
VDELIVTHRVPARAFDHALSSGGQPYGLGVVWGEQLTPAATSEIAPCTPDMLSEPIGQIVT